MQRERHQKEGPCFVCLQAAPWLSFTSGLATPLARLHPWIGHTPGSATTLDSSTLMLDLVVPQIQMLVPRGGK